jgi:hypothetical protein
MARRSHRGGDLRSKLLERSRGTCWLYDRAGQDFRRDFDLPDSTWPEITFGDPAPRPAPAPRFRMGPVARWLFANGGMSVVFLGGIMAFAFIAWALGYR